MTIYGAFHSTDHPEILTMVRAGTLDDVKKLEGRRPDAADRVNVRAGSYVVVRDQSGAERLYHVGRLKADGGQREVSKALEAIGVAEAEPPTQRRAERNQVIKDSFDLGLVLNSGPVTYDVIWESGTISKYRHGQRDVRVATEQDLVRHKDVVTSLRKVAGAARRRRQGNHRAPRR